MNLIDIVYENEEIFIINKPSGLAVQGGQGVTHSVDRDFAAQTGGKVYLVHRLDKDTAGLMVVAKNPVAASKWTKLAGSKALKKEYIAVCAGEIKADRGIIKDDLVQHGDVKNAVTHYEVLARWNVKYEEETIPMLSLKLTLETGRMHQIRIHLAGKGCPIAGDDQHGNFKVNKLLRKACGVKRLLLASVRLTVPLPEGEQTFSINLPEHFPAECRLA